MQAYWKNTGERCTENDNEKNNLQLTIQNLHIGESEEAKRVGKDFSS